MSDLDTLLRDTMHEHADDIPEHPHLARVVVARSRRRRRRQAAAAGVVAVAALALAIPAVLQLWPQQPTAAPAGQPGLDVDDQGLTPGMTRVTLLSQPVTVQRTGTATVALGPRPDGATAVSTRLECVDPGQFFWPDGASLVCDSANPDATAPSDLARAGYVIDLEPGQNELTIEASSGASWWITTAYVSTELTPWGVNAKGETYGVDNENGAPDLIAVVATNGTSGYAYGADFRSATGPAPTSPEEALAQQEVNQGQRLSVPVYESDGETVIGEFVIGDGDPGGDVSEPQVTSAP